MVAIIYMYRRAVGAACVIIFKDITLYKLCIKFGGKFQLAAAGIIRIIGSRGRLYRIC